MATVRVPGITLKVSSLKMGLSFNFINQSTGRKFKKELIKLGYYSSCQWFEGPYLNYILVYPDMTIFPHYDPIPDSEIITLEGNLDYAILRAQQFFNPVRVYYAPHFEKQELINEDLLWTKEYLPSSHS